MNPVSRLVLVVGGQFGSEGKGAVCATLARSAGTLTAVRTGGPNAGHTVMDANGIRWTFRQVPVSAVVALGAELVIAQGSEVDLAVLERETALADDAGYCVSGRLRVDRSASILTDEHHDREGHYGGHLTQRLGSTGKGVGACRADRAMRLADLYGGDFDSELHLRAQYLAGGRTILVEGSQGYGLGLHAEWYPFCTSRNCRAVDDLALCGLLPLIPPEVWVVLRTYPIRVAGNSGPLREEVSWGQLQARSGGYIAPEYTSVTRQLRRVGEWDSELAVRAVAANGGDRALVALQMFDYWYPELSEASNAGALSDLHWERIHKLEAELGARIGMLGTGPNSHIRLPVVPLPDDE